MNSRLGLHNPSWFGRGNPFVQFTYAVVPPIPKMFASGRVEASERIWLNLPPARVWVYRKG